MTTSDVFLKYKSADGREILQSVSDLQYVGSPIESYGSKEGEDMELVSDQLFDKDGNPL